ncbi:MAG: DUF2844 domain-containing protein [Burkholderiaceae bacterium]|nr:DUF2844 domain-containing protein [Burkholderiaceae bacterium]
MKPRFPVNLIAALILAPLPAFASLGGNLSSVNSDQENMKAQSRVTRTAARYSIHESLTPAGTTVREYTSESGTVFGVAWMGPVPPDLRQILGTYFAVYTNAKNVRRAGHRHLLVQQADLVVRSHGHLRAFSGSAYLSNSLPQGVSANDIQ